ncbi:MAG: hypothetical protein SV765_11395 [Pseudomonadota bacterium]|nr:hypothetical protein [Pseudomonadales bacterium]MDY6920801.1 hypothetical protein [Pseudomonadota bacterium]
MMATTSNGVGLLAMLMLVVGCSCCYLSCANQQLLTQRWSGASRWLGYGLLVGSLVLLLGIYQAPAAVAIWFTLGIAVLVVLPHLGAVRTLRRQRHHE